MRRIRFRGLRIHSELVRTNAAEALLAWLAAGPTGTGETDVLVMGDLNSYAREDPLAALAAGGYTDLIRKYGGLAVYSYAVDGQSGYLDHALASASLVRQVRGAGDYHINADEPSALDYNLDFKGAGQQASLYAADEFRMSDHDPVGGGRFGAGAEMDLLAIGQQVARKCPTGLHAGSRARVQREGGRA